MACLALAACEGGQQPHGNDQTPTNSILPAPALPTAEPPLDRAGLLEAVAEARSAVALGRDDSGLQRRLNGDLFEVRIRFGCRVDAAEASDAAYAASFDAEKRTLRLRVAHDLTTNSPAVAALAGEGVETVEGFWLRRPWLLASGCPAVPPRPPADLPQGVRAKDDDKAVDAVAQGAQVPPPRIGIAQFFTETDPRTRRRDQRAYETTKVLAAEEQPSRQGYDLVLSGRLRRLAGGKVIACRVTEADAPPECIVSAEFDRVRIEWPDSRTVLADWRS